MQLPQSKILTTNRLNGIFNKTVATYKFYWFIGVLDLYVKKGLTRMNIWDIMVEMVVNAWYPVCYFHLSFGKSDSLSDAIDSLQRVYDIPINISQAELRKWLHVLNGINLTLFCAKKQKRDGNHKKEMDAEDVHPGVQVGSSELLLHARRTPSKNV